jgi:hypothetical protein
LACIILLQQFTPIVMQIVVDVQFRTVAALLWHRSKQVRRRS